MCDDEMLCHGCGHMFPYRELSDDDRCCRLKMMPVVSAWRMCRGDYFFDKKDGLSLYFFREWFDRLSVAERSKPIGIIFESVELEPIVISKFADSQIRKWMVHTKKRDDDERC